MKEEFGGLSRWTVANDHFAVGRQIIDDIEALASRNDAPQVTTASTPR